ncbi:MAG: hypothetical protein LAN64_14725 [Acidobacteriia bacterium]|nr:hypothetical protein [Terriglobia bacterium]
MLTLALLLAAGSTIAVWAQRTSGSEAGELVGRPEMSRAWPPPEVDEDSLPVAADVQCSLPDVLQAVSNHVKELIANLREFDATERLEHQELERNGRWGKPEARTYKYQVDLYEGPGGLVMDEFRSSNRPTQGHPAELQDRGLPALALVFHQEFLDAYAMKCEGLAQWNGQAAWQVRFEQRPDRTSRLRAYVVGHSVFPVHLKGRAWISADKHQVLRLETDLLTVLPQIRLFREHIAVEYQAVRFEKRNVELWLPGSAEIYMDFRGHRYRRRHTFSDFLLFSVDVHEQVTAPKQH